MKHVLEHNHGRSVLKYASSPDFAIDSQLVQVLSQIERSPFVEFTIEPLSASVNEVSYDVTRMDTVSKWLQNVLTEQDFEILFSSVATMIDDCAVRGLPLKQLELDADCSFFDPWTQTIRFVYLPFSGIEPDVKRFRGFFEALCLKARAGDPRAELLRRRYLSFFNGAVGFNPAALATHLKNALKGTSPLETDVSCLASGSSRQETDTTVLDSSLNEQALGGRTVVDKPASAKQSECPVEQARGTTVLDAVDFSEGLQIVSLDADGASLDDVACDDEETTVDCAPLDCAEGRECRAMAGKKTRDAGNLGTIDLRVFCGEELSAENEDGASMLKASVAPAVVFRLLHKGSGERIDIKGSRFVVGKSKHSSYQVRKTKTVSRSHAIFDAEADACWIEDNGSLNGTFVNGTKIRPHERVALKDGDVVRLSDEIFAFSEVSLHERGR